MKKILLYAMSCVALCACIQAQTLQECKSEQDKISGCVQKKYYENGNLEIETPYQNGKLHGVEKEYDENGILMREIPYKNDKIHGVVKEYLANGNVWDETSYKNGEQHGVEKGIMKMGI